LEQQLEQPSPVDSLGSWIFSRNQFRNSLLRLHKSICKFPTAWLLMRRNNFQNKKSLLRKNLLRKNLLRKNPQRKNLLRKNPLRKSRVSAIAMETM
jgi:hypothetical protein